MASEAGRGAQVRLDDTARALARGGAGLRLIDSIQQKQALEAAGTAPSGSTPDGSLGDGTAADDEVLLPGGALSITATAATYGVVGNGVKDNTAALARAFAAGGYLSIPDGDYLIGSPVVVTLTRSLTVECSPRARFFAPGLDGKMFEFNRDSVALIAGGERPTFAWRGGVIDLSAMKVSTSVPFPEYTPGAKQGVSDVTDAFYMHGSYNPGGGVYKNGFKAITFEGVTFTSGTHWTTAGGDSHLFPEGADLIVVRGCHFIAARDAGIYVSGSVTGTTQTRCVIEGNFFRDCSAGVAIKRYVDGFAVKDNSFYGTARAILSEVLVGPGNNSGVISGNKGYQCGSLVRLYGTSHTVVENNVLYDAGARDADGTTPITADVTAGIYMFGSTYCTVRNNRGIGVGAAFTSANPYFIRPNVLAIGGVDTPCTNNIFENNYSDGWYAIGRESIHSAASIWRRNRADNATIAAIDSFGVTAPQSVLVALDTSQRDVYATPVFFNNGSATAPTIARNDGVGQTGIYFGAGGLVALASSGVQTLYGSGGNSFTAANFLPAVDNTLQQGSASQRFSAVYATNLRSGDGTTIETSGTGSPEGVVAALTGSRYWRTDGAGGSRLYFKATGGSGTNTGWTAIL